MDEQNLDIPQELDDEQLEAISGGWILRREKFGEQYYYIVNEEGRHVALTKTYKDAVNMAQKRGLSRGLINDDQYEQLFGHPFQG